MCPTDVMVTIIYFIIQLFVIKKYSYFTIPNNNISICDMLYVSYLYTYIHETTMPNLVMA